MAFADAYECLYRSGCTDTISVRSYLQKVVPHVSAMHKGSSLTLNVTCSLPDIEAPFNTAVTWALFLNEIVADLVAALSQECHTIDLAVTGAVEESSFSVILRVSSPSNTQADPLRMSKSLAEVVGHGKVGEALIRQSDGVMQWTPHQPPELRVTFPIT
jgi:hypothetical protein